MQILLLAPVHREKEFLKQKDKLPFLKGQGQQSWVEALKELGHQVFVFRYTDSILTPQILRVFISEMFQRLFPVWKARYDRFKNSYYFVSLENYLRNKKLLSISNKVKPELIIISGGVTSVFPETIKKIKNVHHCRVLLFSGVNPITSATLVEKIIIRDGIVDLVVENDRGYAKLWEKIGAKKTIVLPISGVDPKLHKKVQLTSQEKEEYGCDVCFVGSLTRERQEILTNIIEISPLRQAQGGNDKSMPFALKIWGDIPLGESLKSDLKPYYHGLAFGEKIVKIFSAAKIVFNFQPVDMTHGGNMRTFEIPGCGALQIADKVDPDFLVSDEEVILFKNITDLSGKLKYYLQNTRERIKIANNSFLKSHKLHTYQKHFEILFNLINDKK